MSTSSPPVVRIIIPCCSARAAAERDFIQHVVVGGLPPHPRVESRTEQEQEQQRQRGCGGSPPTVVFVELPESGARFSVGAARNFGFLLPWGGGGGGEEEKKEKDGVCIFCDLDKVPLDPAVWRALMEVPRGTLRQVYGRPSCAPCDCGFGVFAMHAHDFERVGGFPNVWGWGLEDAEFARRVHAAGIKVDTSFALPIGDMRMLHREHPHAQIRSLHLLDMYRFATGALATDTLRNLQVERWEVKDVGGGGGGDTTGVLHVFVRAFSTGVAPPPAHFSVPHHIGAQPSLTTRVASAAQLRDGLFRVAAGGTAPPAHPGAPQQQPQQQGRQRNRLQQLFGGGGGVPPPHPR